MTLYFLNGGQSTSSLALPTCGCTAQLEDFQTATQPVWVFLDNKQAILNNYVSINLVLKSFLHSKNSGKDFEKIFSSGCLPVSTFNQSWQVPLWFFWHTALGVYGTLVHYCIKVWKMLLTGDSRWARRMSFILQPNPWRMSIRNKHYQTIPKFCLIWFSQNIEFS
jgi:hypothetical protein